MADNSEGAGKATKKRRGPGRPFKPGQSGNPGGRPKGLEDFKTMCRTEGAPRAFKRLMDNIEHGKDEAANKAAEVVLAYAYGKPTAAVEVTGKDGQPIATSLAIEFVQAVKSGP